MTATQVAFLRAVNVGGKGVVTMADVRAAFEAAGCREVRTLGHAGNVLFISGCRSLSTQQKKIATTMHRLMGTRTDMCFRQLDQIVKLAAANPFGALISDRSIKLYVTFMDREPARRPKLPILVAKEALELTAVRGTEAFIVSRRKPNGMYGFPNAIVEALGVVATTRNWNTVMKLATLGRGPGA